MRSRGRGERPQEGGAGAEVPESWAAEPVGGKGAGCLPGGGAMRTWHVQRSADGAGRSERARPRGSLGGVGCGKARRGKLRERKVGCGEGGTATLP